MKHEIFRGIGTALITPMTATGVDYNNLARLIDFQLESGVSALIAVGTTGESATLTGAERKEVIRFTVERVAGRVPVVAGTGTNDTSHVLDFTKSACDNGADAVLVVTPYYNKATQNGLIAHYERIADTADKPVILYNVPSRTGCNLTAETCRILSNHPNICGVKEASGNLSQIAEISRLCGEDFAVYSGNDDQILPILSLGGKGVISVLANVLPKETHDICALYHSGKTDESRRLQLKLLPLIHSLFSDVNPIPVKEALNLMGFSCGACRLPLWHLDEVKRTALTNELKSFGLLS